MGKVPIIDGADQAHLQGKAADLTFAQVGRRELRHAAVEVQ